MISEDFFQTGIQNISLDGIEIRTVSPSYNSNVLFSDNKDKKPRIFQKDQNDFKKCKIHKSLYEHRKMFIEERTKFILLS